MLRPLAPLACLGLFLAGCTTPAPTGRTTRLGKGHMMVRTTAYVASEPGGPRAATGDLLHFGGSSKTYSCAADWSWIPLGTRFRMSATGRTYVVEDYGSALVGRQTIDLFMPNRAEMRKWGVQTVDIEVLEWGSSAMSLRLLEPRQKNGHVRAMVAALRRTPAKPPAGLAARN